MCELGGAFFFALVYNDKFCDDERTRQAPHGQLYPMISKGKRARRAVVLCMYGSMTWFIFIPKSKSPRTPPLVARVLEEGLPMFNAVTVHVFLPRIHHPSERNAEDTIDCARQGGVRHRVRKVCKCRTRFRQLPCWCIRRGYGEIVGVLFGLS